MKISDNENRASFHPLLPQAIRARASRPLDCEKAEWEAIKCLFPNASNYRLFRYGCSFDPNARLEKTGLQTVAVLRPSGAGGARWMIFDAMTDSMTVEEVNKVAKLVSRRPTE